MKLLTELVVKIGEKNPNFVVEYVKGNFSKLNFIDIDIICDNMAYCNDAKSLYELAILLNEKGYNGGNIDILANGLLSIKKEFDNKVNYLSRFIECIQGISEDVHKELLDELIYQAGDENVKSITLLNAYYMVEDKLSDEDKGYLAVLMVEGKKDFICSLDLLNYAEMNHEQRKAMLVVMQIVLCDVLKDETEKNDVINMILEQYNGNQKSERHKINSFDYDLEKYTMTDACITAASSETIYNLMFSNYDFDESHITRMVEKLINNGAYELLIDIVESKAYTAGIKNDLSDKDIDKIINAVCKTHSAELIYNLADALDGYVTEKQKLRIRRSMFKSNDPDTIIKYTLELDEEALAVKFKSIEKFYNYVDENMIDEKEKQDVKEDILNPRIYKLTNE